MKQREAFPRPPLPRGEGPGERVPRGEGGGEGTDTAAAASMIRVGAAAMSVDVKQREAFPRPPLPRGEGGGEGTDTAAAAFMIRVGAAAMSVRLGVRAGTACTDKKPT